MQAQLIDQEYVHESLMKVRAAELARQLFALSDNNKYNCAALGSYFIVEWLTMFSSLTDNVIRSDAIGDFFREHVEAELKAYGVEIMSAKKFEKRYYNEQI